MAFLDDLGLQQLWQNIIARMNNKVEAIPGKGLSSNDFTDEDKNLIASTAEGLEGLKLQVESSPVPVQSDWDETDETSLAFIKNKPDENDALELLDEMGIVSVPAAEDGALYVSDDGVIYTLD